MVKDILSNFQNTTQKSDILAGIVFKNLSMPTIKYHIRMSSTPRNGDPLSMFSNTANSGWQTRSQFPKFQTVGPRENGSRTGGSPGNQIAQSRKTVAERMLSLVLTLRSLSRMLCLHNVTQCTHFGKGCIMMYFKVFKMIRNSQHCHEINHERFHKIVFDFNLI